MTKIQCSECPRCGAPIYTEMIWQGINPPPTYKTCNCFPEVTITTNTATDDG